MTRYLDNILDSLNDKFGINHKNYEMELLPDNPENLVCEILKYVRGKNSEKRLKQYFSKHPQLNNSQVPDNIRIKNKNYIKQRNLITLLTKVNNPDAIQFADEDLIFTNKSNEDFIEIFLTYMLNRDTKTTENPFPVCWNKYQVGIRKEDVDMRLKKNEKYSYIELKSITKTSAKAENPFFALVESIKNYHLSKISRKDIEVAELIILAPVDYWKLHFANISDYYKMKLVIAEFEKQLSQLTIKMMYINCTANDILQFEDIFNKPKINKIIKSKIKSKQYIYKNTTNTTGEYNMEVRIPSENIYDFLCSYIPEIDSLFELKQLNSDIINMS